MVFHILVSVSPKELHFFMALLYIYIYIKIFFQTTTSSFFFFLFPSFPFTWKSDKDKNLNENNNFFCCLLLASLLLLILSSMKQKNNYRRRRKFIKTRKNIYLYLKCAQFGREVRKLSKDTSDRNERRKIYIIKINCILSFRCTFALLISWRNVVFNTSLSYSIISLCFCEFVQQAKKEHNRINET